MTHKQEAESRYGIKAPEGVPDVAVVLPPPSHGTTGGALTETSVRAFADQAAVRSALDRQGWRNLVQGYQQLGITPLPPGPPSPHAFHIVQANADGSIVLAEESFTVGMPASYRFEPEAWVWFWDDQGK